ncbi:unnamed protein product [Lactuca virosa]|uniref:Protein xylosyltransferase n=1 Tax=Lactuca virosa TaxID=75947 RepID=A0AAU9N2T3_9ASTR|nr:unnamed protein product [Lactuca virosa]
MKGGGEDLNRKVYSFATAVPPTSITTSSTFQEIKDSIFPCPTTIPTPPNTITTNSSSSTSHHQSPPTHPPSSSSYPDPSTIRLGSSDYCCLSTIQEAHIFFISTVLRLKNLCAEWDWFINLSAADDPIVTQHGFICSM